MDRGPAIPTSEFLRRQAATFFAVQWLGCDIGFVFSDEHYDGDVPYLGGNTNITIEQVAGVIGRTGSHIIAGLEGGYVGGQLAGRAEATVHKVEMLQLADEKYPIDAEQLESVCQAAAGGKVRRMALLSPKQVVRDSMVTHLEHMVGTTGVTDGQEAYYGVKYEKSAVEMDLIREDSHIGDAVLRAMLAVLKPGMLETEIAARSSR